MGIQILAGELFNIVVGIVFLTASIGKYLVPNFFIFQLKETYFGKEHDFLFYPVSAFTIMGVEFIAGVFLLINYLHPLPSILSLLLLIFFISYVWLNRKENDNCGCFGIFIKRTPLQSIMENVALILLLIAGILFKPVNFDLTLWKNLVVIISIIIVLLLSLIYIYRPYSYPKLNYSFLREKKSIQKLKSLEDIDYQNKKILLVATSMSCHFCKMQLPFLKAISTLLLNSGTRKILMILSEKDDAGLPDWFGNRIEIKVVKNLELFGLIANGRPATALIENGVIIKVWNFMLPFPWDFPNERYLPNELDDYFSQIIKLYSNFFKDADHNFLITVLFEQGVRLFEKQNIFLALKIFETVTTNAVKYLKIDDVSIAKGFENLSLIYIKQEDLLKAYQGFEKAAVYYNKARLYDSMIDSFAKSFAIASLLEDTALALKISTMVLEIKEKYLNENLIEKFDTISSGLINDQLGTLKESNLLEAS